MMARKFGLGSKLGIEIPSERSGLMPDKEWKLGRFGKHWTPGETINASIGQGYTLTTPLQLAVMTARMVNGGYQVEPHIIVQDRIKFPKLDVNPKHIVHIQKGMDMAVNHEKGTALGSRIEDQAMTMAGKLELHKSVASLWLNGAQVSKMKIWNGSTGIMLCFAAMLLQEIHAMRAQWL